MSLWGNVKAHGAALSTIVLLIVAAVLAPIDGGGSLWGVSMLECFLIAGGVTGADLLQATYNIRSAEKPLVEGQISYLTTNVARRAGLPGMETLSQPIQVQKGNVNYELQAPLTSKTGNPIRISQFQTDDLIKRILIKLHEFQVRTGPDHEGNV